MAFLPLLGAILPSLIQGGMSLFNKKPKTDSFSQSRSGSSMGGGSPRGYDTFSTFSPQQEQAFNQLLSQLSGKGQGEFANQSQSYFQNILGGDTGAFEAPLMREFNEKIIPGLAERFSGAGAGAQSSSAFQNALGGAGADLAERLGALRGGLQLGAAKEGLAQGNQNMNSLQNLLGMSTRGYVPQQKGFMESSLPGLLQALISAGGTAAGGYFGRTQSTPNVDWFNNLQKLTGSR